MYMAAVRTASMDCSPVNVLIWMSSSPYSCLTCRWYLCKALHNYFRCLKSDLNIRPVHHQNDVRVEAHIYQTILAYQLVNTIRHMLKDKGIRHDWTNVVRIMNTQTVQTLELPTDKKSIHLRKPSRPIKEVQDIYTATNSDKTQTAVKKYVV